MLEEVQAVLEQHWIGGVGYRSTEGKRSNQTKDRCVGSGHEAAPPCPEYVHLAHSPS